MHACSGSSLVVVVAIAGGALLAPAARADFLLGVYDNNFKGGFRGIAHSAVHSTFLSTQFGVFKGQGTIWNEITLNDGDSRVDEMTFGDDPDFERYVELITDGQDWYIYDQFNFDDGTIHNGFGRESQRLPIRRGGGYRGDLPGPDLIGATVLRIVRTVSLDLDTPGSDPNGDGIWTDVIYSVETRIYGMVPGSGGLALLGLSLLGARRRRP